MIWNLLINICYIVLKKGETAISLFLAKSIPADRLLYFNLSNKLVSVTLYLGSLFLI